MKEVKTQDRIFPMMMMLFMGTVVAWSQFLSSGSGDIVSFMRANSILLLFFILPIIFILIEYLKPSSIDELKSFIQNKLMNYVGEFIGLLIATFALYLVIVDTGGRKLDYIDILIQFVLMTSAFVLFMFSKWIGKPNNPPLTKKSAQKLWKFLRGPIYLIVSCLIVFSFIQYILFDISLKGAFFLAYFHAMFLAAILFPRFKTIYVKVLVVLLEVAMFFLLVYVLSFMLIINPNLNFLWGIAIFGAVVIVLEFLIVEIFRGKPWFVSFLEFVEPRNSSK